MRKKRKNWPVFMVKRFLRHDLCISKPWLYFVLCLFLYVLFDGATPHRLPSGQYQRNKIIYHSVAPCVTSALIPYALGNGGKSTAAEMREPATTPLLFCARNEHQRAAFRPSGITRFKSFNNAKHEVIAWLTGMASAIGCNGGRMIK
jgi:hypothetical protein